MMESEPKGNLSSIQLDLEEEALVDDRVSEFDARLHRDGEVDPEPFLKSLSPNARRFACREIWLVHTEWVRRRVEVTLARRYEALSPVDRSFFHADAGEQGPSNRPDEVAGPTLELDLNLPTVVGYTVLQSLGEGATAVVYLARQLRLRREVALKIPKRPSPKNGGDEDLRRLQDRFRREARIQAKVASAGVPTVYEFGLDQDGRPFIAMELITGPSFAKVLAKSPPGLVGDRTTLTLITALCRGLVNAHDQAVYHLDLKPGNLRLNSEGVLKALDWGFGRDPGLVTEGDHATPAESQVGGTPGYMAPEQLRSGARCDGKADVFAIGVLLLHTLTGQGLFRAGTTIAEAMTATEAGRFDHADAALSAPDLPADLVALTRECLEPSPERRPRAGEVADRIDAYFAARDRAAESANRRRLILRGLGALALILAAAAVISLRSAIQANRERQQAERNFGVSLSTLGQIRKIAADLKDSTGASTAVVSGLLAISNEALVRLDQPGKTLEVSRLECDLANLAADLSLEQGRTDQALRLVERAIASTRRLSLGQTGEEVADQERLWQALINRGRVRAARGTSTEALADLHEARAVTDHQLASHPEDPDWSERRAVALIFNADQDKLRGYIPEASAAYDEALAIRERLVQANPDQPARRKQLAVAHARRGHTSDMAGRRESAFRDFTEVVRLFRDLVKEQPNVLFHRLQLADASINLASLYTLRGEPEPAKALYDEAHRVAEALALTDPLNGDRRQLAMFAAIQESNEILPGGDRMAATRQQIEEIRSFLPLCQRFTIDDPAHVGWQRRLAQARLMLGMDINALVDGGKIPASSRPAALAEIRESVTINSKVAAIDPENLDNLDKFKTSAFVLATATKAAGDTVVDPTVLTASASLISFYERRRGREPSRVDWVRGLGRTWAELGRVQSLLFNDLGGARAAFDEAIAAGKLARELAPADRPWLVELADMLAVAASVGMRGPGPDLTRRRVASVARLREAVAIYEQLTSDTPADYDIRTKLVRAYDSLAVYLKASDHADEADALRDKARSFRLELCRKALDGFAMPEGPQNVIGTGLRRDPVAVGKARDLVANYKKLLDLKRTSGKKGVPDAALDLTEARLLLLAKLDLSQEADRNEALVEVGAIAAMYAVLREASLAGLGDEEKAVETAAERAKERLKARTG